MSYNITAIGKKETFNTFGIIRRIKHFFSGQYCIYEVPDHVILPLDLSDLGRYHLPLGFTNHNIAQKEVFYPVDISQCNSLLWE